MSSKIDSYEARGNGIAELINTLERKSITLSILRLVLFLIAGAACVFAFVNDLPVLYIIAGIIIAAFAVLCVIHSKVNYNLKYSSELYTVNSQYILRITGDFDGLYQIALNNARKTEDKTFYSSVFCGDEFNLSDHDYCQDFSLFGKKSIYSLISVCETVMGRKRLAHKLLYAPVEDNLSAGIKTIQDSCRELASDTDSLQELQALARLGALKFSDDDVRNLFKDYNGKKISYRSLYIVLPLLWLIPIVLIFINAALVKTAVLGILIINFIVWGIGFFRNRDLLPSGTAVRKCSTLRELYLNLEMREFKSEYLSDLVSCGFSDRRISDVIDDLCSILKLSGVRSQPLFALLINLIFPLDYYIVDRLSKWNDRYGSLVEPVLDNIGEIETLASVSQIAFISNQFTYPSFVSSNNPDDNAYFDGENICHPLINTDSCVPNSVKLNSNTVLITGSNMSGKTTLIRTVGICALLAYMGGPVPAKSLELGKMRIMSSMRIVDSLEENMSTFKAELVRISRIIDAGREGCALLFLIDEIFRGTNSDDRTAGAYTVLKNLSKNHICGMMTTHDYALIDKTENKLKQIAYYYFSEKYDDNGILFDYILREGISRSSNAQYLMRLVGIDKGE